MTDQSIADRLAHRIAYATTCSDIETHCAEPKGDPSVPGGPWYDPDTASEKARGVVEQAVEYLELRKLIVRHPTNKKLFRVLAEERRQNGPLRRRH